MRGLCEVGIYAIHRDPPGVFLQLVSQVPEVLAQLNQQDEIQAAYVRRSWKHLRVVVT